MLTHGRAKGVPHRPAMTADLGKESVRFGSVQFAETAICLICKSRHSYLTEGTYNISTAWSTVHVSCTRGMDGACSVNQKIAHNGTHEGDKGH